MYLLLDILVLILICYLCFSTLVPFILSVSGRTIKVHNSPLTELKHNKILVMIPCYGEDIVIINTVKEALKQSYPKSHFSVLVIADSMNQITIRELYNIGAEVLEVSFQKSTKTKSLNKALQVYSTYSFDAVVVLDADNIMCEDFLEIINQELNKGRKAIQGQRVSKNHNNTISSLDGLSEIINNHQFCKGQYLMGGSSRLSGSGMAFTYDLLRKCLKEINVINGFDKYLELSIVAKKIRIHYCQEATILDEKVSNHKAFQKQRTRWLAAQYLCLINNFKKALKELFFNKNIAFPFKVLLLALPPKVIFLPFLILLFFLSLLFPLDFNYIFIIAGCCVLYMASFIIAIPKELINKDLVHSILKLPSVILPTIKALFNINKAKSRFLHTVHEIKDY